MITGQLFTHPAVTTHAAPYTVIEMDVVDTKIGAHRHIDLVFVLRATSGALSAQLAEVAGVQWAPVTDLTTLDTPPELPALAAAALHRARDQQTAGTPS